MFLLASQNLPSLTFSLAGLFSTRAISGLYVVSERRRPNGENQRPDEMKRESAWGRKLVQSEVQGPGGVRRVPI